MASAEESKEDVLLSEEQVDALTQLGEQPDDNNNDDQKLPANDDTNLKVDTTNDNKVVSNTNKKKGKGTCTFDGCNNKQVKGRVCQRHGAKVSFPKCTYVLSLHMICFTTSLTNLSPSLDQA